MSRLVIAGGVSANRVLRERLDGEARSRRFEVFYPELELCTDNGAMIAFAAARRGICTWRGSYGFEVHPRWNLAEVGLASGD